MPTPIAIPTPTPTPTAQLTPFERYQAELQRLTKAAPTPTPAYRAYGGAAPSAPSASSGIGAAPGLGVLLGMKLASSATATPALASSLGAGVTSGSGALMTGAGLKGASLGASGAANAASGTSAAVTPAVQGIGITPYLGAAGALAGGYGLYNAIQGNDKKSGALSGAALGGGLAAAAPLVGLGPVGWAGIGLASLLGAGGGAGLTSLFGHKSTKEYQREKWGNLADSAHSPTQNYANNYLNYLNSDQAKIDAQYPNTFEGKKAAGTLKAEDVWGGHGMFKTFGDDWLGKYTEDQRRAVSNALLANDLIRTSKGDQYITDEARAKELAASSIQSLLAAPVVKAAIPLRSSTSSPGISKDGKRISYGKR